MLGVMKRLVAGVAIGAAAFLLGETSARWAWSDIPSEDRSSNSTHAEVEPVREEPAAIRPPGPDLSPRDVVETQLAALRQARTDPATIRHCFAHASPENRQMTGPLERFTQMVLSPSFLPLVKQRQVLVGKCVYEDSRATVLVTVLDEHRQPTVYRFYLSKQPRGEFQGCWMTDAVQRNPGVHIPAQPSSDKPMT